VTAFDLRTQSLVSYIVYLYDGTGLQHRL